MLLITMYYKILQANTLKYEYFQYNCNGVRFRCGKHEGENQSEVERHFDR